MRMKSLVPNMDWKRLYAGYLATPFLWKGTLNGMKQFAVDDFPTPSLQKLGKPNMRLGQLAEHFAFDYWAQTPELTLFAQNLQIQGENETLGEIDAILQYRESYYHIEMAFKVYLYDDQIGTKSLEHWIGPNRKDSLVDKLNRTKTHQLPLLHRQETKRALHEIIDPLEPIHSRVWLKALLFVPHSRNVDVSLLNPDCVAGFYVSREEFTEFADYKYYLPSKQEWMMLPHTSVEWLDLEAITKEVDVLHERQFSPMIWLKNGKGELQRMFVVWY
ncbi:MAG: hypothetical protein Crog4KO_01040 [Crocinitomicaceae bacterium]